uniref:Putative secreted protein n=1 Tax=Ixodes ricinus TaxID=34613 RepID=A0A6B0U4K9_IXORI
MRTWSFSLDWLHVWGSLGVYTHAFVQTHVSHDPFWQQLLPVLLKLRLGLLNRDPGLTFGMGQGTVSKVFHEHGCLF